LKLDARFTDVQPTLSLSRVWSNHGGDPAHRVQPELHRIVHQGNEPGRGESRRTSTRPDTQGPGPVRAGPRTAHDPRGAGSETPMTVERAGSAESERPRATPLDQSQHVAHRGVVLSDESEPFIQRAAMLLLCPGKNCRARHRARQEFESHQVLFWGTLATVFQPRRCEPSAVRSCLTRGPWPGLTSRVSPGRQAGDRPPWGEGPACSRWGRLHDRDVPSAGRWRRTNAIAELRFSASDRSPTRVRGRVPARERPIDLTQASSTYR
jgi:hypothetical protein